MSQIAKRTKKGDQSKADLAQRDADEEQELPKLRRSLRRRSLRYNLDFAHYLDEDDGEEEEDERLEKKLKLVVKLPPCLEDVEDGCSGLESRARKETSVAHAPLKRTLSTSRSVSNPLKKRRIYGCDVVDEDPDCDGTDEGSQRDEDSAGGNPISATASYHDYHSSGYPLPDKKSLELILDKLQKKDVYGVFAEPVDSEELPDYHDIIEHPMDFSTVRKKLDGGSYLALAQFESDVFLICSNAMQYNAPDTIYHKQARAMQDLATRRFEGLRIEMRRREKEHTLEDKPKSKPKNNTLEHLSSDFSSGATLTVPDVQNTSMANISSERPSRVESLVENRRSTYTKPVIATLPMMDIKELIPVGLHLEHSYARSLARFAATLGPVAWRTAKNKIQQGLPSGVEFGRGWVGQHEPLPKSSLSTPATEHPSNSLTTHSLLKGESKESGQCPNSANRIVPSVHISADSLYNSAREGFVDSSDQKARCFPTNGRPLLLSWFHKKKQETLPPDLNIGFQSSGSLDTSGLSIESSHPDLALQL